MPLPHNLPLVERKVSSFVRQGASAADVTPSLPIFIPPLKLSAIDMLIALPYRKGVVLIGGYMRGPYGC